MKATSTNSAPRKEKETFGHQKMGRAVPVQSKKLALVAGRSPEGVRINNTVRLPFPQSQHSGASSDQSEKQAVLIGIRGQWYDVTTFLPHHPGGDVLLDFAGRDATAQFMAYHSPSVLKYRKPVGTYDFDTEKPGGERMQGDWMKLCEKYEAMGYFRTPLPFVLGRISIQFGFLFAALGCIKYHLATSAGSPGIALVVGAVCLAGFWQQSGFLMHDCMHNLLFHNRRVDQFCGWICGNVILGISSKWWRDEHNEHHLFTNTGVESVGPSDPQMIEDGVWMQDPMIEQFYHDIPPLARKLMARFQHLYFIPACVFVGPYTIKFLSIVFAGNRPMEHFGIALYFAYVAVLLSFFPTWKEALIFYAIGNTCLGVLSVQLLVSHYSKPWVEKDTVKESGSWAKRQIESVVDISCPPWLDWFHGGLHLHSPHHLFPRMPRCYYREVHKEVIDMCKKNKVPLEVMPWFEAIANTVRHLRQVGELINSKKVD